MIFPSTMAALILYKYIHLYYTCPIYTAIIMADDSIKARPPRRLRITTYRLQLMFATDAVLNYMTIGWPRLHVLVPGQIRVIGHSESRV